MPPAVVYPWESRDAQDQAEAYYNDPLRAKNKLLEAENLRLKKMLFKNGIPWSQISQSHLAATDSLTSGRVRSARRTRSSLNASGDQPSSNLPRLPTEVLLRVLHFALTSKEAIVDPLSPKTIQNMTAAEAAGPNEIAIGFLATCKTFHTEGKRVLWSNNKFVFTQPVALLRFAELDFSFRKTITHVNLRIIARYYDDENRKHRLINDYHPSLKKDLTLKVSPRVNGASMARKGFRCYSWTQVIEFLGALRAPFDPKHNKKLPQVRLLPALESMRIDFVNFPADLLPFSDTDFHNMTCHELGYTLNELQLTGLPCCDSGLKASTDLAGMVKDDGLFLDGNPAFVQTVKNGLKWLEGSKYNARAVRTWRRAETAKSAAIRAITAGQPANTANSAANQAQTGHSHSHSHNLPADMPYVPAEVGHPQSSQGFGDKSTIWKRVPTSRDAESREWVEFDRTCGMPISLIDDFFGDEFDDEERIMCVKCGGMHAHLFDELDFEDFI